MKRKKHNKEKHTQMSVQYPPFGKNSDEFFVEEGCDMDNKSVDNMDYNELCETRDGLVESIMDIDTIIEIELNGKNADLVCLRSYRKRRQQHIVELRDVRNRIKMIEKTNREKNAA